MVVYTASIVSKNGTILLSRQFLDMSKNMIDQYLSSFICRLDNESQHTFIDGENVRYVYQPLGTLYMIVLTSLNSNIFEDLEIVRAFSRIVSHYCYPINEETVRANAFTLIYAFDELVSLGYRENVTLDEINRIIDMHSENEILADIVKKDRENQAKETMKRKAKEFELMQKLQRQQEKLSRKNNPSGLFNSPLASLASHFINNLKGSSSMSAITSYTGQMISNVSHSSKMYYDNELPFSAHSSNYDSNSQAFANSVKSLKLTKEKRNNPYTPNSTMAIDDRQTSKLQPDSPKIAQSEYISHGDQGVCVELNENISSVINRNGQLEKYELTGLMTVSVINPDYSKVKIKFSNKPNPKLILQTHPNIDKKLFSDDYLVAIKEGGRNYPLNCGTSVLKWRYQTSNIEDLILLVNSWVDKTSEDGLNIIIDLELNDTNFILDDVAIMFPISPHYKGDPNVISVSDGRYHYKKNMFVWEISIIDKNAKNASIELSLDKYTENVESIYPIKCSFSSRRLFLGAQVKSLTVDDNNLDSKVYSVNRTLKTINYEII